MDFSNAYWEGYYNKMVPLRFLTPPVDYLHGVMAGQLDKIYEEEHDLAIEQAFALGYNASYNDK